MIDEGPRMVAVENIWGMAEIAAWCDASAQAVWNWTKRLDFPKSIARVSNRPVWDAEEVQAWFLTQKVAKNGWLLGQRREQKG